MCIETNLLLHLPLNTISFYCFVFGATLVQYNLHYYVKKKAIQNSERIVWSQKNKTTHRILILIGLVLLITSLFSFRFHHLIFLAILGAITFLYSVPVLPFKEKKRIKDYGLLKIITITLLWTLVTVWFPVDGAGVTGLPFQLIFIRRFIFIFVLCLMFDIRDAEIDLSENIRTLPIITGIKRSYRIAYVLLIIFILLSVLQVVKNHNIAEFNAMIISALATFIMIEYSKKNNSDFVFLACIDGMMLLQAGLVIIGSI